MGKLLICTSCDNAVAKSAITCSGCGGQLQKKGLNIIGVIGVLMVLGCLPSCLLLGPLAIGQLLLGMLLVLVGRSYSPRWFVLRRVSESDAARLKLAPGSGALLTPAQTQLISAGVFTLIAIIVWTSWSDSRPKRPAVEPQPAEKASTAVAAPAPQPEAKKLGTIAYSGGCNVREEPSGSSKKVGFAASGKRYDVFDRRGQWRRLKLDDGTEGWAACTTTRRPASQPADDAE